MSSSPAWAGLNVWINTKMNLAAKLKKDEPAATTPQPPIAMTAMGAGNDNKV